MMRGYFIIKCFTLCINHPELLSCNNLPIWPVARARCNSPDVFNKLVYFLEKASNFMSPSSKIPFASSLQRLGGGGGWWIHYYFKQPACLLLSFLWYLFSDISFLTCARFAVSSVSRLAETKVRSFSVPTVGIDVTWDRRSTALVNIY